MSPVTAPPAAPPSSALRRVLGTRFYRSALAALFVSGIGVSATAPQLTLFLVGDLGASLPVAGLYYLTNLAAPVVGFLVGSWSDRRADRLPLFRICAVVGALGWVAMAAATQVWMPFVIGAVALSVSGASSAQLFAAVRDELSRCPTGADNRVLSAIRMAFTAGWILGPVLGSWFGSQLGLRSLLLATAVCTVGQVLPLGRQRVLRFVPSSSARTPPSGLRPMLPLLVFTGLCALAMSGDTIKFAYLPIYLAGQLGAPDTVRGAVIAVQPLLELILMPFCARLADRFGPLKLVVVGTTLGTGAHLTYALSTGVTPLFVGQLLMAGMWAAVGALGVSVAQQLYPQGVGRASGVFLSSITMAGAVGGLIGGLGVAKLGLPHVFWIPMGLSAVATIGLVLLTRRVGDRLHRVGSAAPRRTQGGPGRRRPSDGRPRRRARPAAVRRPAP